MSCCGCNQCTCNRKGAWSSQERGLLEQLWNSGASFAKIVGMLPGRTLHDIVQECDKLGLPSARAWSSNLETK